MYRFHYLIEMNERGNTCSPFITVIDYILPILMVRLMIFQIIGGSSFMKTNKLLDPYFH